MTAYVSSIKVPGINDPYNVKDKRVEFTASSLTGSIVTFNSQYALPLKSHIIALIATQSGSGTPSPSNPRPISGYSAINISQSGADTSNPTVYVINLGGTYYFGEYDARTGVLTVTHILFTITNVDSVGTQGGRYFFRKGIPASSYSIAMTPTNLDMYMSETYYPALDHSAVGTFFVTSAGTSLHLTPTDQTLDTVAKMNTFLTDNPAVCVIPLAESLRQTIQLPPCPIDTLQGVNNIWADTGDTTLQYISNISPLMYDVVDYVDDSLLDVAYDSNQEMIEFTQLQ